MAQRLRRIVRHVAGAAAAAAVPEPHGGVEPSVEQPGAEPETAPPLRLLAHMRPPNDTSRKWVKVDENGKAYAVGRRKKAIAKVWVWEVDEPWKSMVRINGGSISRFFGGYWVQRHTVLEPFFETKTAGKYAVKALAKGGGITGQAEAIRLGIATALQGLDASLRPPDAHRASLFAPFV